MEIEIGTMTEISVARVTGRVDATAAPEMERRCGEATDAGSGRLVLDLSAMSYISSAGLRAVLATAQRATDAGGQLRLVLPGGLVREIFEISGFLTRMPVYPDVDAAVRAYGRK